MTGVVGMEVDWHDILENYSQVSIDDLMGKHITSVQTGACCDNVKVLIKTSCGMSYTILAGDWYDLGINEVYPYILDVNDSCYGQVVDALWKERASEIEGVYLLVAVALDTVGGRLLDAAWLVTAPIEQSGKMMIMKSDKETYGT